MNVANFCATRDTAMFFSKSNGQLAALRYAKILNICHACQSRNHEI